MWQAIRCAAGLALIMLLTKNNVCTISNVAVGWH